MAEFIKLGLFDPLDPYEKIIAEKNFEISLIENPEWDTDNHIWFDYKGNHMTVKGDYKEFKKAIGKD